MGEFCGPYREAHLTPSPGARDSDSWSLVLPVKEEPGLEGGELSELMKRWDRNRTWNRSQGWRKGRTDQEWRKRCCLRGGSLPPLSPRTMRGLNTKTQGQLPHRRSCRLLVCILRLDGGAVMLLLQQPGFSTSLGREYQLLGHQKCVCMFCAL